MCSLICSYAYKGSIHKSHNLRLFPVNPGIPAFFIWNREKDHILSASDSYISFYMSINLIRDIHTSRCKHVMNIL